MRVAVGRADLVRLVALLPPEKLARAAALLGFEEAREREAREEEAREDEEMLPAEPAEAAPAMPAEPAEAAPEREPMSLWRMEAMTFPDAPDPEPTVLAPTVRLTQDDLTSPGRSLFATRRAEPLATWSRLWPVLRAALQASVPGRDPDVPALVRAWGRGEVVRRVPRVRRRVSAGRASVWVDRSARLVPFWADQVEVCHRLRAACGQSGLEVRLLDARTQALAMARRGDLLAGYRPHPETPVLVLGDLGVYGSPTERAAWFDTARRLRCAGVRVAALVPSPRSRWDPPVATAWAATCWERGRLGAGTAAEREPRFWQERAERLLRLAAPACLVQPGLLRALRLLLPARDADAATEADAWKHADVRAADATGLVFHTEAANRLRSQFAADVEAGLKVRVSQTIGYWHGELPRELLRAETLIWHALVPGTVAAPPGDLEDALAFARRMEGTARSGEGEPAEEAAVRRYERALLGAMPAAAYAAIPGLSIVWAVAYQGVSPAPVPSGLDPLALYAELGRAGEPRWWAVRQVGCELVFSPSSGGAWPSGETGPGSPMAWLLAARPHLYVKRGDDAREVQLVLEPGLSVPLHAKEGLELRTDLCVVTVSPWRREPWAVAAGRDRFGLWADAKVKGVVVRFRWIPPGRFVMGSAQHEAGSFPEEEGPRHRVTWTQGMWLADTPVTQAFWEAVMGNNPSTFRGPDRPVEQVSWDDCQEFLRNGLLPGLDARLPSEAEWEHACRARTATATWLGNLEIGEDDSAPLLDAIAWYSVNSGGETHPVRGKAPNPLGLFDMLGNVHEWCLDAWNRYHSHYAVSDPPVGTTGSSRVSRGGSWFSNAWHVRAASRLAHAPGDPDDRVGFRLARGQVPGLGGGARRARDAERTGESERGTRPDSGAGAGRNGAGPKERRVTPTHHPLAEGLPEPWASEWGEDRFGPFMSFAVDKVVQRMRWVPPGRFMMGSPDGEAGRYDHEGPQHWVDLRHGLWVAETPCTQALWQAVMGENPSQFVSPDRPVEQVSWDDCQAFLHRLEVLVPGLGARLPTEAEWEYACRGGTTGATWAGELDIRGDNDAPILDAIAWYGGNSGHGFELADGFDSSDWPGKQYPHMRAGTHPVGRKLANPLGLHDMLGNVFEWCEDWWGTYPAESVTDPRGPAVGSNRVFRGGSWFSGARCVRAADRGALVPGSRGAYLGFRLARGQGPGPGAEPLAAGARSRRT